MRRQSKIEATLNTLFKKPSEPVKKDDSDAPQQIAGLKKSLGNQPRSRNSEATPEPQKGPTSKAGSKQARHTPMRVDTISTTFTLDLNEVLVSPPFEEVAETPLQELPEPVAVQEKADKIQDWYDHQIVTCILNEQFYAVRIDLVEGIIKMQEITSLPISQPFIAGIINLRGSVLPVINLRKVLGLRLSQAKDQSRHILLVNAGGFRAGLIVDQVSSVLTLPNSAYEILPTVSGENPFIAGIARQQDRLILLIDLGRLINSLR